MCVAVTQPARNVNTWRQGCVMSDCMECIREVTIDMYLFSLCDVFCPPLFQWTLNNSMIMVKEGIAADSLSVRQTYMRITDRGALVDVTGKELDLHQVISSCGLIY